jgi:adenosylmethionine---8-amino-7-oxononanoate aminotransferase
MSDPSWPQRDQAVLWHPFTRMAGWLKGTPTVIERAEGHYLIDTEGRRYLDGISSLWVNLVGHQRPEIDEAIRAQLGKVAHTTLLGLSSVPAIELAERLVQVGYPNLGRVFFSDNGSTAVEIALKLSFQYWKIRGEPERRTFLALSDSYHGDTLGSVSLGGIDLFHRIFHPLLFHVKRAPSPYWYHWKTGDDPLGCRDACLNALAECLEHHHREIAAFVIEPLVQGAAGMIVQPDGYLREAVRLCRKYDVLVVFDEVAVGFGRTGTWFAGYQEGVSPDLLALAKGVTGGYLPLAATLTTEAVFSTFLDAPTDLSTFFHGHSYTGNPLACAAGIATLDLLSRDRIIEQVPARSARLARLLEDQISCLPHVGQIRQKGLMVGIELVADRSTRRQYSPDDPIGARVCQRIRDFGVMLRPLGSVIVLLPPLTLLDAEMDSLVEVTARGITEVTT